MPTPGCPNRQSAELKPNTRGSGGQRKVLPTVESAANPVDCSTTIASGASWRRHVGVFGARQDPESPYSAVIPLFIKHALGGTTATIYGDGMQSRDFTYAQLQNRLDQMYVDKHGKVSESFYERKAGEWRAEQDRIAEAIEEHRRADRSFADAGVQLLELAGGAYDAFLSQGSEERRKLLQLVVSNSTWKHGRLALELHAPFDLILKEVSKAREADCSGPGKRDQKARF